MEVLCGLPLYRAYTDYNDFFHKILPFTRSWQDLQSFKRPFTCFEILIDHKQLLVAKYFHINHRWSLDGLWQENTQICSRLTFIKIHE